MVKTIDLIGMKFNRYLVTERAGSTNSGQAKWLCKCDCGNEKIVAGYSLKSGNTKSCGCLNKEITTKHGHCKNKQTSRTLRIWNGMIQRCLNPSNPDYKYYGGRGIKICDHWLKFKNFLDDIGEIPKDLTIDRINNDGNYEPNNWKLSTRKEQARNRRNNISTIIDNKYKILKDYCKTTGLNYNSIMSRIHTQKLSIKEAISRPIKKKRKK